MDQLLMQSVPLQLFYMDGYIDSGTRKYKGSAAPCASSPESTAAVPLRSTRGLDIRPTSDRLRESLFNVLTAGNPNALEGSVWFDLFAGTGAVGIEALSRGAEQVYFVETSPRAAQLIQQNLQSLGIVDGSRSCATIFRESYGAWSGNTLRPT